MAISSKPQKTPETLIEQIINKGGSIPEKTRKKRSVSSVRLNVPTELLQEIDTLLKNSPIPKTRHSWILEAMLTKLKLSY